MLSDAGELSFDNELDEDEIFRNDSEDVQSVTLVPEQVKALNEPLKGEKSSDF